jgi:3-methyladenine DNA glycosylase AlkD
LPHRQYNTFMDTAQTVLNQLTLLATPERAQGAARFFKTGPGQYGEGDKFLGVTVPEQRKLAKHHQGMVLTEVVKLLRMPFHECRSTALFIMVLQYKKASDAQKLIIYNHYIANTKYINNWDLVDSSAGYIVGPQLGANYRPTLTRLASSDDVWERRIAMIACFHYIMKGNPDPAFYIIELLKTDTHDLIQKAVGWMLREIGKRCSREQLTVWLLNNEQYKRLPRTTLRYAIEHYSPGDRKAFLAGTAAFSEQC